MKAAISARLVSQLRTLAPRRRAVDRADPQRPRSWLAASFFSVSAVAALQIMFAVTVVIGEELRIARGEKVFRVEVVSNSPSLEMRGLGARATGELLKAAIAGIKVATLQSDSDLEAQLPAELPDISIPSTKISLQLFYDAARWLMPSNATRVDALLFCPDEDCTAGQAEMILRIAGQKRVRPSVETVRGKLVFDTGDAGGIFRIAAVGVLKHLDPYLYAAHLFSLGHKHREEARLQALKIVAAAPAERARGNLLLALIAREEKRFDEALGYFERSVDADPQFGAAYHNWANMLVARGRHRDAIATYDKALAATLSRRLKPWSYAYRGDVKLAGDDLGGAIADFRAALAIEPAHAYANASLGGALMRLGQYREALSFLVIAEAADPARDKTTLDLGLAMLAAGRYGEARDKLIRAEARYHGRLADKTAGPRLTHAEALSLLAVAQLNAGEPDTARQTAGRVLETALKGKNPQRVRALRNNALLVQAAAERRAGKDIAAAAALELVSIDAGADFAWAGRARDVPARWRDLCEGYWRRVARAPTLARAAPDDFTAVLLRQLLHRGSSGCPYLHLRPGGPGRPSQVAARSP